MKVTRYCFLLVSICLLTGCNEKDKTIDLIPYDGITYHIPEDEKALWYCYEDRFLTKKTPDGVEFIMNDLISINKMSEKELITNLKKLRDNAQKIENVSIVYFNKNSIVVKGLIGKTVSTKFGEVGRNAGDFLTGIHLLPVPEHEGYYMIFRIQTFEKYFKQAYEIASITTLGSKDEDFDNFINREDIIQYLNGMRKKNKKSMNKNKTS